MQSRCLKGKLVSWNDDKGRGVIKPDNAYSDITTLYGPANEQEIAFHISALQYMSRRPRVGDNICFQIETKLDSKLNAYDASIEGAAANSPTKVTSKANASNGNARQFISSSGVFSRLVLIASLLVVGRYAYQHFFNG